MSALGYAYSNKGFSWRSSYGGADLQAGEVFFPATPDAAQLEAAFPGYSAAAASAALTVAAQAQYAAAIAAGLAITWTGSAPLNATYPLGLDPITQTPIAVEALAELSNIAAKGTFISGATTRNWPDVTGTPHAMTVAQFQAMYGACAAYLDALATALGAALLPNGTWAPPSATVTLDQ